MTISNHQDFESCTVDKVFRRAYWAVNSQVFNVINFYLQQT